MRGKKIKIELCLSSVSEMRETCVTIKNKTMQRWRHRRRCFIDPRHRKPVWCSSWIAYKRLRIILTPELKIFIHIFIQLTSKIVDDNLQAKHLLWWHQKPLLWLSQHFSLLFYYLGLCSWSLFICFFIYLQNFLDVLSESLFWRTFSSSISRGWKLSPRLMRWAASICF